MIKKRMIIAVGTMVILVVIVIATQIAVSASSTREREENVYERLGKIETQKGVAANSVQGEIAYVGDHITITSDDLARYTQRTLLLTGEEKASEQALRNLAVREVFCYQAKEAGITNDDEEFAAWLTEYRKDIENASNYYDFEAMIKGTGMTEEEYWDWASSSESFRKEYYSTLFSQKLREDFKSESTLVPGSEEYQSAWHTWFEEYKDKVVADEHLKPADGAEKE